MSDAAVLIDGKALASEWLDGLAEQVRALNAPVGLAAVCVGDDPGLKAFVKLKQKAAESIGVTFSSYFLESQEEVREALGYAAADESIHGVFVELPLPGGWDRTSILSLIPPEKDVDALTPGALVPPPAVRALERLLQAQGTEVRGMRVAVVGHGFLVGGPIARWLGEQGAMVSVIDIDTPEPERIAAQADLLIAGAGRPGLVTGAWVKEGAFVVDFGYGKHGDRFVGDVAAESVQKKAGVLTPVPGGMGPLLIAAVLENLLELATR
jgi:methylenetetrahydrofolate dehydrogenase (NADP+)/methenyltetrahydrofolate cyclohydrolase